MKGKIGIFIPRGEVKLRGWGNCSNIGKGRPLRLGAPLMLRFLLIPFRTLLRFIPATLLESSLSIFRYVRGTLRAEVFLC